MRGWVVFALIVLALLDVLLAVLRDLVERDVLLAVLRDPVDREALLAVLRGPAERDVLLAVLEPAVREALLALAGESVFLVLARRGVPGVLSVAIYLLSLRDAQG